MFILGTAFIILIEEFRLVASIIISCEIEVAGLNITNNK